MNMATHEIDCDILRGALADMARVARRKRVWRVRRWLWVKALRLVITSPMGAACLAIWAVQIAVSIAKRIGGAP